MDIILSRISCSYAKNKCDHDLLGLMRDYFTHKITTPKHWRMLMMPTVYTRGELDYDLVVGRDTIVTPSYDPHCENGDISGGCEPALVVSAEKLRDYTEGPSETELIANLMRANPKMAPYVIDPEAWDCIWRELIVKGKGLKTGESRSSIIMLWCSRFYALNLIDVSWRYHPVSDRPNSEVEYNFSAEMLDKMIW
jgi:hypothetical protein